MTRIKEILVRGVGAGLIIGAPVVGEYFLTKTARAQKPTPTPRALLLPTPTPIFRAGLNGGDVIVNNNNFLVDATAATPAAKKPEIPTPTAAAPATATATRTHQQDLDNQKAFLQSEINRLTREKATQAEIDKMQDRLNALLFPPEPTPKPAPTATIPPTPTTVADAKIIEAQKAAEEAEKQKAAALLNKKAKDTQAEINAINGTPTATSTPTATGTPTQPPTATATFSPNQIKVMQQAGTWPTNTATPLPEALQKLKDQAAQKAGELTAAEIEARARREIEEDNKKIKDLLNPEAPFPLDASTLVTLGAVVVLLGATGYLIYETRRRPVRRNTPRNRPNTGPATAPATGPATTTTTTTTPGAGPAAGGPPAGTP